jgi:hypothetical protein
MVTVGVVGMVGGGVVPQVPAVMVWLLVVEVVNTA